MLLNGERKDKSGFFKLKYLNLHINIFNDIIAIV